MPRCEKSDLKRKIRELLCVGTRFVDIAARLRVYRRNPITNEAEPAELLPRIYGGVYDTLLRQYVVDSNGNRIVPEKIAELKCHEGQLPFLLDDGRGKARVVVIGGPGGGKTFALATKAVLIMLDNPNTTCGSISPVSERIGVVWDTLKDAILDPLGWIKETYTARARSIRLINNSLLVFKAAKRQSEANGSPLQGWSFDFAFVDETQSIDDKSHIEIAARGRRNKQFVIFEVGTNDKIAEFRLRIQRYKANPEKFAVLHFDVYKNPWADVEHWEKIKAVTSDREWSERFLCVDGPSETRLYPRFDVSKHVKPIDKTLRDITQLLTIDFPGGPYRYIVGQDFGVLKNVSIILRCFASPDDKNDRIWWAVDELTTSGEGSDMHARRLISRYDPEELLVIADPHLNTKENADGSDYTLFRNEGLTIIKACMSKKYISKRHRIAMVNALLCDASLRGKQVWVPDGSMSREGKIRLFIDCDKNGTPACKKLAETLLSQEYGENLEIEMVRKNSTDPTHWTAALGYGLFPFESIRGNQ